MPELHQEDTFPTRIGTIVSAARTTSFSGRRDIGGSAATASGRIALAVGAADAFNNTGFKIVVSDDGGATFDIRFEMPVHADVTYHTLGMLYDRKNDILMGLFGETRGHRYWVDEDDFTLGTRPFSPEDFGHSQLRMARSVDDGATWQLFTLHDYGARGDDLVRCNGIGGSGVQIGDDLFVPQVIATANEERNASRGAIALSRIRNLDREDNDASFEFENAFRMLATRSDLDIRYADETVYVQTLDETGFLSFHRPADGMPFRRAYDADHHPVSDFIRVQSRGFDPRDFPAGDHGPKIIAFNVVRLPDGNLMMASRFYGTAHHRAGNIFMTSTDEGLTWEYDDDQVPYCLRPLRFAPDGSGGNPSMSYLSDASLVHTTSGGCREPLGDSERVIGGTLINRFQGMRTETTGRGEGRTAVSLDVSGVAGLTPVYIADAVVAGSEAVAFGQGDETIAATEFSADRRRACFVCRTTGPGARLRLRVVLANKANGYRPVFEPTVDVAP